MLLGFNIKIRLGIRFLLYNNLLLVLWIKLITFILVLLILIFWKCSYRILRFQARIIVDFLRFKIVYALRGLKHVGKGDLLFGFIVLEHRNKFLHRVLLHHVRLHLSLFPVKVLLCCLLLLDFLLLFKPYRLPVLDDVLKIFVSLVVLLVAYWESFRTLTINVQLLNILIRLQIQLLYLPGRLMHLLLLLFMLLKSTVVVLLLNGQITPVLFRLVKTGILRTLTTQSVISVNDKKS